MKLNVSETLSMQVWIYLTLSQLYSTEATYCIGDAARVEALHWHLVAFFSFVG